MNQIVSYKLFRYWTFILLVSLLIVGVFFYFSHFVIPRLASSEVSYLIIPQELTQTTDKVTCTSDKVKEVITQSELVYKKLKLQGEAQVKGQPSQVNPWAPYIYPYDYFPPT